LGAYPLVRTFDELSGFLDRERPYRYGLLDAGVPRGLKAGNLQLLTGNIAAIREIGDRLDGKARATRHAALESPLLRPHRPGDRRGQFRRPDSRRLAATLTRRGRRSSSSLRQLRACDERHIKVD